ncbi:MAG: hypothetical protein COV29_01335 [Candidatus Yanofskybacteria bacterium CG10_big_fil_rev_8_21_14_0_10_36_16]|uniref:Uncharacterized protein n=1 Tax=Candidatus Yanofskybacteria bacterium CG10_big_fil_rev_8_21_14_0_10_36_16 TaxID=1975096 RepID=A0A2J0Q8M1_9BACT|nr:MAG: hypothetical protein COV29_01335 [Candidatus Yanofskybacteria bacterium CG10_big_fil_rev_8_21_14_0_10_36_16]
MDDQLASEFTITNKLSEIKWDFEKNLEDLLIEAIKIVGKNLQEFKVVKVQLLHKNPGEFSELRELNSGEPKYFFDSDLNFYLEFVSFVDQRGCRSVPIVDRFDSDGINQKLKIARVLSFICDSLRHTKV